MTRERHAVDAETEEGEVERTIPDIRLDHACMGRREGLPQMSIKSSPVRSSKSNGVPEQGMIRTIRGSQKEDV